MGADYMEKPPNGDWRRCIILPKEVRKRMIEESEQNICPSIAPTGYINVVVADGNA